MAKHKTPVPDGHFLNTDGPIPLVVRHEDGVPTHAVVAGRHVPYAEFAADLAGHYAEAGAELPPPKEFSVSAAGRPPSVEEMTEALKAEGVDLEALVAGAGPGHFLHLVPGQPPLVVEDATGEPKYRVEGGKLEPIRRG